MALKLVEGYVVCCCVGGEARIMVGFMPFFILFHDAFEVLGDRRKAESMALFPPRLMEVDMRNLVSNRGLETLASLISDCV